MYIFINFVKNIIKITIKEVVTIFFKHKIFVGIILIISIICLICFIKLDKKEEYNGTLVKEGDNIGYICKTL